MKKTLEFKQWAEPDPSDPEKTIISDKIITFENDGQFTKNSLTDKIIPQDEEQFIKIMNVYLAMDLVSEITN